VRRGLSFSQLTVSLLFGAIVVTACLMPAQSDTYWHLRAGQDIWRTLRVPLVDAYSYTAAGQPWPNHEWLWQALSYGLYRLGGMPALVLAGAAIVTAAAAIAYRLMVGSTVQRFSLMLLALPFVSCVWALRPQIVSLLLLCVLVALLARERYLWLPPLFVLWANVHGAVALGGVAVVAAATTAGLRARRGTAPDRRRAISLLALVPVCAAATMATPLGTGLWRFIAESTTRSARTHINEWLPTYPTGPIEAAFWIVAAAFLALLVRRRARLRGALWQDQVLVGVALAILPFAFRAVRNIAPFALLALPASSRLLGADFRLRAPRSSGTTRDRDHVLANMLILTTFVVLAVGVVGAAWRSSYSRLGWRPLAPAALAAARACPGRLYNSYNEGGFLIWFAPERRVFIDSRQDPYPLPFLLEALGVEHDRPYRALFARFGVTCALLPVESPLLASLRRDQWDSRYLDDKWAVMRAPASR
jgi:hypothetical protein